MSVATGVRRRRADVCGSPLVVRCSCHLEPEDGLSRLEGAKTFVRLRPPRLPRRANTLRPLPKPAHSREESVTEQQHIRLVLSKQECLNIHRCLELTKPTLPFIDPDEKEYCSRMSFVLLDYFQVRLVQSKNYNCIMNM